MLFSKKITLCRIRADLEIFVFSYFINQTNTLRIVLKQFFRSLFILLLFSGNSYGQEIKIIDSLLFRVKHAHSDSERLDLYNELSWEFAPVDFKKAKSYAEKALALTGSRKQKATAYNCLGVSYDYAADYERARDYYGKAAQLRLKLKDSLGYANILNNIGATYYTEGYLNKALEYYQRSADIRELIRDERGLSQISNNIGLIYRVQKRYDSALSYYKSSLRIKEKLKDTRGILNTCTNIGVTYLNLSSCDSAHLYFSTALTLARQLNDNNEISSSLSNLGYAYLCSREFDSAKSHFLSSLSISNQLQEHNTTAHTLKGLGELYQALAEFDRALTYFRQAFDLAQKTRRKELLAEIALRISQTLESRNDPSGALEAYKQHILYRDSVFSEENTRHLNELEARYKAVKKEKQIKDLSHQTAMQKKESQRLAAERNLIIFVSLLVLITALITFYYLRRNKKMNQLLSEQSAIIAENLHEKEVLLKEIHHRVKNNLQIINGLLELQEGQHDDSRIKNLVHDAQGRIKTMSIIHEMLYQTTSVSDIPVANYVDRLVRAIQSGFSQGNYTVRPEIRVGDLAFSIDTIIPLGLIISELLTNSFKYAFVSEKENIFIIEIIALEDGTYELLFADNGSTPVHPGQLEKSDSFGLKLVRMLSRQLKGQLNYTYENGLRFRLVFRETEH